MAAIRLVNVTKRFSDKKVVDDISLEIEDKEFLVLLGPSGCGKSTLLRMLAGLEGVSDGHIEIAGRDATRVEPKERDLAFVFQSYALYPHMSVRRNMSFPLLMRAFRWWHHVPVLGALVKRRLERSAVISGEVTRVSDILGLEGYMDSLPRTLSGGQRQRVAVGRAMVRDPVAYLMDEPLSNLDAKLRVHMRREISRLHRSVDKTFVYVTHDQTEAMTMGTRIAVMRDGVLQQHGAPQEIFQKPATVFVARFIGSPPMNVFPCQVLEGGKLDVFGCSVTLPPALSQAVEAHGPIGSRVLLGVRPEHITVTMPSPARMSAAVQGVEHLGSETLVSLIPSQSGVFASDPAVEMIARIGGYKAISDSVVGIELDLSSASLFDAETERRISESLDRSAR